jgi:thiamine biosynthesis lipoprotein
MRAAPVAGKAKSGSTLRYALLLCLLASALIIAVCLSLTRSPQAFRPAENPAAHPVSISETRSMLGTYLTLTVVAESESKARADIAAGFARIAELDKVMSFQRPDSELSRLNAQAGLGPVVVSDDLYRAVETGVTWCGRTMGTFDIAVGPLVELWQTCGKLNRLPTAEEFARVKPLLGAGRIILDPAGRTIRFPVEGMRLDLGGLKGFIADEVTKLMVRRGVKSALVAMAGDIHALGRNLAGGPWRVGVQDPRNAEGIVATLELADRSVSTSGNYERFVEIQGRRYSHIVDPRTCQTAESVPSVTVIAPDTVTSDVLCKPLSILGVQDGLALLEKFPQAEAMFITYDEKGEMRLTRSKGFAAYEAKP